MDDPFMAEIGIAGFSFNPMGWALCQGQVLAPAQNSALFSLIGTYFGGNGSSTFNLPDLRGRVIVGMGQGTNLPNYTLGEYGGLESVTLTTSNMPAHIHAAALSNASATIKAYSGAGTAQNPGGRANATVLSGSSVTTTYIYGTTAPDTTLNVGGGSVAGAVNVGVTGSSSSFSIMPPYCAMNICIALQGIYPVRE